MLPKKNLNIFPHTDSYPSFSQELSHDNSTLQSPDCHQLYLIVACTYNAVTPTGKSEPRMKLKSITPRRESQTRATLQCSVDGALWKGTGVGSASHPEAWRRQQRALLSWQPCACVSGWRSPVHTLSKLIRLKTSTAEFYYMQIISQESSQQIHS